MWMEPEYLVCLECESPTYVFEWGEGKVLEVVCEVCGSDDPDDFLSQEDYEDLVDSASSPGQTMTRIGR